MPSRVPLGPGTMVKMPLKKKGAGYGGGANFPCVAFDFSTGLQIPGQSCTDPTQPGNNLKISGYFDGMIVNPAPSFPFGVTWDGTFKFTSTAFLGSKTGWFAVATNGQVDIQNGSICNCVVYFTGTLWRCNVGTDGTNQPLWSGNGAAKTGTYVNNGIGQDAGPASITIVSLAGNPTTISWLQCAS